MLLESLHLDGLANLRIRLERGRGGNRVGGDVFGGHRFLPERQSREARPIRFGQWRPNDAFGDVVDVSVEKESGQNMPVFLRTYLNRRRGCTHVESSSVRHPRLARMFP